MSNARSSTWQRREDASRRQDRRRRASALPGSQFPQGVDGTRARAALPPWSEDQRAAIDVIESVTPAFFLPPEHLREIPVIDEVDQL